MESPLEDEFLPSFVGEYTPVYVDQETVDKAIEILNEEYPGHGLGGSFKVYWIREQAQAQLLLNKMELDNEPQGFDYETVGWSPSETVDISPFLGFEEPYKVKITDVHPCATGYKAIPRTFQLSAGRGTSFVVDAKFLPLFADWLTNRSKPVIANQFFEQCASENMGIPLLRIHSDPGVQDYYVCPAERGPKENADYDGDEIGRNYHGLKQQNLDHLGIAHPSFKITFGKDPVSEVLEDPSRVWPALCYAALDSWTTLLLSYFHDWHLKRIPTRDGMTLYDIYYRWEKAYQSSVCSMQRTEVPIRTAKLRENFLKTMADRDVAIEIKGTTGFRPTQTDKIAQWLTLDGDAPVIKTGSGWVCGLCRRVFSRRGDVYTTCEHGWKFILSKPSADKDTLKALAAAGYTRALYLKKSLKIVRDVDKVLKPYLATYSWAAQELGGKIAATVRSNHVSSGRLSAPWAMTAPKRAREVIGFADASKYSMGAADWGQLEFRLIGEKSKDPNLFQVFNGGVDGKGKDIHTVTAVTLALRAKPEDLPEPLPSLPVEDLKEWIYNRIIKAKDADDSDRTEIDIAWVECRAQAKTGNFGALYNAGASTLAKQIGSTVPAAQNVIDAVDASYPEINKFVDRQCKVAHDLGHIHTIYGRIRDIRELRSDKTDVKESGRRLVKNQHCQASAADFLRSVSIAILLDIECSTLQKGRGYLGHINDVGEYVIDWSMLPAYWEKVDLPEIIRVGLGSLGLWGCKVFVTIHDEIVIIAPDDHIDECMDRIQLFMEDPFFGEIKMKIKFIASKSTAKVWSKLK